MFQTTNQEKKDYSGDGEKKSTNNSIQLGKYLDWTWLN